MYKQLLLSILIIFVSIEVTLRLLEDKLSLDLKHYHEMNAIVSSVTSTNDLLFLGNSLTRRGIDQTTIQKHFPKRNIHYIYPDDTTIVEWTWILKSKVLHNKNIKHIFLSFANTQLQDKDIANQQIIRLASIISFHELFTLIQQEHLNINQSLQLIFAHFSKIIALQDRINKRFLDLLPHYRYTTQAINQHLQKEQSMQITKHNNSSADHLKEFIKICKQNDIHLYIIAMPVQTAYTIPLRQQIEDNNVHLIELNALPMDDTLYLDHLHLNPTGAKRYSHKLAETLQSYDLK